MAERLRFTVLPVGQGMGTLLQVLDGTGKPLETSLIDLGSLGWSKQAGVPSATAVVEELKKMDAPRLSALFVSHADSDHLNLLNRVLEKFKKPSQGKPPKETLIVDKVWYGGAPGDYVKGKRKFNLLKRIEEYKPVTAWTNINPIGLSVTSWGPKPAPLYRTPKGVGFWLLVGNVAQGSVAAWTASTTRRAGSHGYLRNVVSLVLLVEYGQKTQCFVAPGDATGLTLAACNQVIQDYKVNVGGPVLTMGLPHHGSAVTTYDLLGITTSSEKDPGKLAAQCVKELVDFFQPQSITASAGEVNHKHPASRVIQDFGAYLKGGWYVDLDPQLQPLHQHFFTAYYPDQTLSFTGGTSPKWPPKAGWYTGRTYWNVFSTDYFRGVPSKPLVIPEVFPPHANQGATKGPFPAPPPRAAGWAFELHESGTYLEVLRVLDRNFTSAHQIARLEAVHGPLAPDRFVFVPSAPPGTESIELAPEPEPPVIVAGVPPPGRRMSPSPGSRRFRQLP